MVDAHIATDFAKLIMSKAISLMGQSVTVEIPIGFVDAIHTVVLIATEQDSNHLETKTQ